MITDTIEIPINWKKYVLMVLLGGLPSVILVSFVILESYFHTPVKIESYVKKHCDFRMKDTCFIDLRKVLRIDYDTMYVFNSLTVLSGVRNIIGISDYDKSRGTDAWIGYDSEMCRIILVKNGRVVYEDEYHPSNYNTTLLYDDDFPIVEGQGIFDGSPVSAEGYMCTNYIFRVTGFENKYYRVEGMGVCKR